MGGGGLEQLGEGGWLKMAQSFFFLNFYSDFINIIHKVKKTQIYTE